MSNSYYENLRRKTEEIKQLDLIAVAEHLGYSFKKRGRTYECNEDKGLVYFPDTNTYYHFYENKGGTVIDFYMRTADVSFKDAVTSLSEYLTGITPDISYHRPAASGTPVNIAKAAKDFTLPETADNYRRAYAYLQRTRGIDAAVISRLMHENRIYEEKEHHNIIFVGTDSTGEPKHGFIRGSISDKQFRGDVAGSDKDYGFNIKGSNDILVVFEAPIDLLSYMTIFPDTRSHLLALGMLSESPVDKYIMEHPEIKSISFLLDNDAPGIDAIKRYEQIYKEKGYNILNSSVRDKMADMKKKDVNELLIALKSSLKEMKQGEDFKTKDLSQPEKQEAKKNDMAIKRHRSR